MAFKGTIERINGSLIVSTFNDVVKIGDVVSIGDQGLMGEIVRIIEDTAFIQCYEQTSGLKPGEQVIDKGAPLVAELGPGILGTILDGIGRPEIKLWEMRGPFVERGVTLSTLDRKKHWAFTPVVKLGDQVHGGDILGTVQETEYFQHNILVPPNFHGTINAIERGEFTVEDTVSSIKTSAGTHTLKLMHTWPVRLHRPYKERLHMDRPLITGQRVIDTFFPIAKGGTACIAGGFGAGKTMLLQQISKWSDADIIIFIGCGERGNEMADVVYNFPQIQDPRSKHKLIERTVIIANVSNMPVSAREASIYLGATIAEYYRDQGYDVAVIADSTSRWAEALRDISGRLEEIPAEGGYPAYLADRLAEIYERAGRVSVLGSTNRTGSLTIMGAVSPPGSDFSEPVTTNTLRFVGTFWALDYQLAFRRQFPAINQINSFTRYLTISSKWWSEYDPTWETLRINVLQLLEEAAEIEETARIIGEKSLPDEQRFVLLIAEMYREGFLRQNATHPVDTYCEPNKQIKLATLFYNFFEKASPLIQKGIPIEKLREYCSVAELMRLKEQEGVEPIDNAQTRILTRLAQLSEQYEAIE
jgi:V/A-type H+-transporting ATPase subunit A